MAVLVLLALLWWDSSGCASPPSNVHGWFLLPAPSRVTQAAGLSTPSLTEPSTTLTMANCSFSFYKLCSKYLGMPNISAAAGIPVCKLFINQCLNSQGTLLSINYLSPSSCGLGVALLCFQTTACYLSLLLRLRETEWCEPGNQGSVLSTGFFHGSACGVMAQGFGVPSGFTACSHCPARLMPGARGIECPARKVNGIRGSRDGILTSDTAD